MSTNDATADETALDKEVAELLALVEQRTDETIAEMSKCVGKDVASSRVTWRDLIREAHSATILRQRLEQRVDELEQRLSQVELGGLKFCGVYQRAIGYDRGSVVSHEGSAWIALQDLKQGNAPGDSNQWQLAVKKGRDAR